MDASVAETEWQQIAALVGALSEFALTSVVQLNAAMGYASGIRVEHRLVRLGRLDISCEPANADQLPAARAELLRRASRNTAALATYDGALALDPAPPNRAHLTRLREEPAST